MTKHHTDRRSLAKLEQRIRILILLLKVAHLVLLILLLR